MSESKVEEGKQVTAGSGTSGKITKCFGQQSVCLTKRVIESAGDSFQTTCTDDI